MSDDEGNSSSDEDLLMMKARDSITPAESEAVRRNQLCSQIPSNDDTTHHIVLMPNGVAPGDLRLVSLPHPGGRSHNVFFGFRADMGELYELKVQLPASPHTSWYVPEGQEKGVCYKSGKVFVATLFDVIYFFLYAFSAAVGAGKQTTTKEGEKEHASSQQQHTSFRYTDDIVSTVATSLGLESDADFMAYLTKESPSIFNAVFESKDDGAGGTAFRISKEKVVEFLNGRVAALAALPSFMALISGSSVGAEAAKTRAATLAAGIVGEYLTDAWRAALCAHLKLDMADTRRLREKGQASASHFEERKRGRGAEAAPKASSRTASAPAVKRPKGVADIASFFKKK
eukprot:PhM_4_TR13658/c0_g1_i2/m.2280/K10744/RNASEH2B; ribonuclease H2 subunit B